MLECKHFTRRCISRFISLGFACIFLARVIGITGTEAADLLTGIANIAPDACRQEQLDQMTNVADEATRLGNRAPICNAALIIRADTLWCHAFRGVPRPPPPARPYFD